MIHMIVLNVDSLLLLSTLKLESTLQSGDKMTEESLEDINKSNESGNCRNICNLLREMKKFCVEKNIEKAEEIHKDSDIFNDAIKKSNKEGNHELIYDLLRPGSSLSIQPLYPI